jgi:hypothetical protein
MHTKFESENVKGPDHLENTGVNGTITRKCLEIVGRERVDWINLAQDRIQ